MRILTKDIDRNVSILIAKANKSEIPRIVFRRNLKFLLKLGPYNKKIYNHLAQSYFNSDDYFIALKYINKGIKIDNKYVPNLLLKARILARLNKLSEQFLILEDILKLDPLNFYALTSFSNLLVMKGDYTKAIKYINKALKINPTSIFNLRNKAMILSSSKRKFKDVLKISNFILKYFHHDELMLLTQLRLPLKIVSYKIKVKILKSIDKTRLDINLVKKVIVHNINSSMDEISPTILLKYAKEVYKFDNSLSLPLIIIQFVYFNKYPNLQLIKYASVKNVNLAYQLLYYYIIANKYWHESDFSKSSKYFGKCLQLYINNKRFFNNKIIMQFRFTYASALYYAKKNKLAKKEFTILLKLKYNYLNIKSESRFILRCINKKLFPENLTKLYLKKKYYRNNFTKIQKDLKIIKNEIHDTYIQVINNQKLIYKIIEENPDRIYKAIKNLLKNNKIDKEDSFSIKKLLDDYIKITDIMEKTIFWIKANYYISKYINFLLDIIRK